jgi:acyl-homoserine lactone acylase PvdQ
MLLVVIAVPSGGATNPLAPEDHALVAGTIVPPGTDHLHAIAEVAPYDNLVYDYPSLTEDTLYRYFKDARFGPQGTIQREYTPRAGVRVVRDERWGVPHVYGETDRDVWFGAGYVSAEDRLAIMELLRALGRAEAFELLGTTPAWLADFEWTRLYGYTEEELQEQLARLPKIYGAAGDEALVAIREFVAGINTYIAAIYRSAAPLPAGFAEIGHLPLPWRETDVVAVTTVIRALFGANGGNELGNAALLASLQQDLGTVDGSMVYEDFRNRENLDAPVHTPNNFPYGQPPAVVDPAAHVMAGYSTGARGTFVNAKQLAKLAAASQINWRNLVLHTPLGSIDLRPKGMSNALVVGAGRAAAGHPILLGGPQTGYFSPEILMEVDLHGATIHARGAAFPGISVFVLLGRSRDAAWTATAGGGDMIDTFIEKLCEADGSKPTEHSYGYVHDGGCVPMDRRLHRAAPKVSGVDLRAVPDIWAERTIHGTVIARGVVGSTPVAVVRARTSYMREVDSAVPFIMLNRNLVTTGEQFVSTMGGVNMTINWMFAGQHDIAYYHSGLFANRHPNVHPDFPVWGTGQWDWQGFLDPGMHPHEVNPAIGYITSWNNKPARGWAAHDGAYSVSSLYRNRMLADRIAADSSITPVELVKMMEEAGLTDFRGSHVLPTILRVLDAGKAPGPREAEMVSLLRSWLSDKALRRDSDQDGHYEHGAAIAIMDQWWGRLIHAMYDPILGEVTRIPVGFDNAPNSGGSAYQTGFYGQVLTDLQMLLGDPLASPTSRIYCGKGNLATCSAALWGSLRAAGDQLASDQGEDPSGWDADPVAERIVFLGAPPLTMHWVNRPTFQQLTQFGG